MPFFWAFRGPATETLDLWDARSFLDSQVVSTIIIGTVSLCFVIKVGFYRRKSWEGYRNGQILQEKKTSIYLQEKIHFNSVFRFHEAEKQVFVIAWVSSFFVGPKWRCFEVASIWLWAGKRTKPLRCQGWCTERIATQELPAISVAEWSAPLCVFFYLSFYLMLLSSFALLLAWPLPRHQVWLACTTWPLIKDGMSPKGRRTQIIEHYGDRPFTANLCSTPISLCFYLSLLLFLLFLFVSCSSSCFSCDHTTNLKAIRLGPSNPWWGLFNLELLAILVGLRSITHTFNLRFK